MVQKTVSIVGAGGHAEVVASTLIAAGVHVTGFYDDDMQKWGTRLMDIPVIGPISELSTRSSTHAIMGVGINSTRKRLAEQLDLNWITAVHPFSWVHPQVRLGAGTVVCAGSIVQPGAQVGQHVILNTKASVDHHCRVGDFVHIAVAHLAGGASIDEGGFMALGSVVLPGVHVGAWATVGAGALATHDVLPGVTVVGAPAHDIRKRHHEHKKPIQEEAEVAHA